MEEETVFAVDRPMSEFMHFNVYRIYTGFLQCQ